MRDWIKAENRDRLCEDSGGTDGEDKAAEGDHVAAGGAGGLGNASAGGTAGGCGRRGSLGGSGAGRRDGGVNTWDNGHGWLGDRHNWGRAGDDGRDWGDKLARDRFQYV